MKFIASRVNINYFCRTSLTFFEINFDSNKLISNFQNGQLTVNWILIPNPLYPLKIIQTRLTIGANELAKVNSVI